MVKRHSSSWALVFADHRSPRQLLSDFKAFLWSTPKISHPEILRGQLVALLGLRVLILSLYLGLSAAQIHFSEHSRAAQTFTWLFATMFIVSLANLFWLRFATKLVFLGYVQLWTDVLLATLAIYATDSMAAMSLYILVIAGSAVVFGGHGAVVIAACSGIFYAALISGLILPLSGFETGATQVDILSLYVALVVIGLVSVRFTKQLHSASLRAGEYQKDLNTAVKQQRLILDDISDGIITLNLNNAITNINKAARAILSLTESDAESLAGKSLDETFTSYGIPSPEKLFAEEVEHGLREVSIRVPRDTSDRHLNYTVRPLADTDGNTTGKILIFNDVSHIKDIKEKLSLHEQMAKLLSEESLGTLRGTFTEGEWPIIGESPLMQRVFALVDRVSSSEASILITGESGTGKELVARSIHWRGNRRGQPFVAINCGAMPENLIESELFGHKRGSFTGAINENIGLFRRAQGGTIFLDEIGELPLALQAKLLRVLQEKRVRSVGDTRDSEVDVRVVAATNRDLRKEIAEGRFREDLYYRLNVVNIFVPPLRDRRDDIPLLVRYFIAKHCAPDHVLPQVSPEALRLLTSYPYPGNIRELENVIERALVLGGNAILPEHLSEEITTPHHGTVRSEARETDILTLPMSLEGLLEDIEKRYLLRALDESGGVKKQAAELLGLNFRSFRYRLKKYELDESLSEESDDNTM